MKLRLVCILLAALLLCGCGAAADPYAGMVQVSDGMGGLMWVDEQEDVPVNTLDPALFAVDANGRIRYTGTDFTAITGVDVSFYQGAVDWQALARQGVGFAIVRIGYRGCTQGQLFADETFVSNLQGAADAGLLCGVYFFSQAITPEEAVQEAEYVLSLLDGRPLSLPVFFDWEPMSDAGSRTADASAIDLTACAAAFCTRIEEGGYDAGVYLYRRLGYFEYDLAALQQWSIWAAALGSYPDFYYAHDFWQYSITGRFDGIEGDVDLDLWLIENLTSKA